MRETEFKEWLEGSQYAGNTVNTQIAQSRRLNAEYGDLDEWFQKDGFAEIRKSLAYSKADERAGKSNPAKFPIDGKLYENLASYRSTLSYYARFARSSTTEDQQFERGMESMRETFLERMYDFQDMRLEDGEYWEVEKSYKYAARGDVFSFSIDPERSPVERGKAMYDRLCQSAAQGLPLSWRTRAEVQKASQELQERFYLTIAGFGDRDKPIGELAEEGARSLETLRSDGIVGLRRGEVLNITLSVLGTLRPNECCWFKTSIFDEVGKLLLGKRLFPSEFFDRVEFEEFQTLLFRMQDLMDQEWDWQTETLEDVQGFVWVSLTKNWNGDWGVQLDSEAVDGAMDEYDELGEEVFYKKYSQFQRPTDYWVLSNAPGNNGLYPSKPIAANAAGKHSLNGGWSKHQSACTLLHNAGYQIVDANGNAVPVPYEKFSHIKAPEKTSSDDDLEPHWFVGASYGRVDDQTERFLEEGIWEIHDPSDRHRQQVLSMEPGQRIAIKATYVRKNELPFDNRDRRVSVMMIKAIGTIASNPGTGERVAVDWETAPIPREWYHYTYQPTVWEVYPDKEMARRLIAFAFDGEEQDYDWFLANLSNWQDLQEIDDSDVVAEVASRDPQNLILYGPPGTGKTFRTMSEAVRLCDDLSADDPLIVEYSNRTELRNRYEELRELGQIGFVTFHQNFSYEDFVEGLRPKPVEGSAGFELRAEPGIFRRMAEAAKIKPENHVLIIDEINRANISKVFGELITLIERDKRLGMDEPLTVRLPYSRDRFGVPANLHIVGTMNTADRSIALLDTALRRRFSFLEIAPDSELLPEIVDGVPLRSVLETMNDRIEYLIDREHCVGHAFFMGVEKRQGIDAVMRDKIIPLLQEYFFEDWGRLAAVLGETAERGGAFLECRMLSDPTGQGSEDRPSWRVREHFSGGAYKGLIGKTASEAKLVFENDTEASRS